MDWFMVHLLDPVLPHGIRHCHPPCLVIHYTGLYMITLHAHPSLLKVALINTLHGMYIHIDTHIPEYGPKSSYFRQARRVLEVCFSKENYSTALTIGLIVHCIYRMTHHKLQQNVFHHHGFRYNPQITYTKSNWIQGMEDCLICVNPIWLPCVWWNWYFQL